METTWETLLNKKWDLKIWNVILKGSSNWGIWEWKNWSNQISGTESEAASWIYYKSQMWDDEMKLSTWDPKKSKIHKEPLSLVQGNPSRRCIGTWVHRTNPYNEGTDVNRGESIDTQEWNGFLRIGIQSTKNEVIYLESNVDAKTCGGIPKRKPPLEVWCISHMFGELV